MPSSFYASIDPSLLDKVTRFFNASLGDVFTEIVQNARRAGASQINVEEIDDRIVIRDDGKGIDDPRTLLTLGQSRWHAAMLQTEDPAGCGVFALSPRGAVIRSRPAGSAAGWTMTLTPDHFTGRAPVTTEPCSMAVGTEVTFPRLDGEFVQPLLSATARYCPIPITLDGEALDQASFLEGAVHVETWKGLRVGMFKERHRFTEPNVNFHGLTLKAPLPSIAMVMGRRSLSVRVDVVDCPHLKLVLPARKEIVRDEFFKELAIEIKRTLYRSLALDGEHHLSAQAWREAADFGVTLPEACPALMAFEPATADHNRWRDTPALVPVKKDGYVVTFSEDAPGDQCFDRAVRENGLDLSLYEPCPAYEGYSWYDNLACIAGFRCHALTDGQSSEVVISEQIGERLRPDRIELEIGIEASDGSQRQLRIETDLLVTGDPAAWPCTPDEIGMIVTKDSALTPEDLTDFLEAAYFSPSDDADDDSFQTQQERFRAEALQAAIGFLLSEDEALRVRVRHTIEREVLWLVRGQMETSIIVKNGQVDVSIRPCGAAADDEGLSLSR